MTDTEAGMAARPFIFDTRAQSPVPLTVRHANLDVELFLHELLCRSLLDCCCFRIGTSVAWTVYFFSRRGCQDVRRRVRHGCGCNRTDTRTEHGFLTRQEPTHCCLFRLLLRHSSKRRLPFHHGRARPASTQECSWCVGSGFCSSSGCRCT